jgi:hypothetical protein
MSVSEIQEEDKKKFKKLAKAPDIAFKVLFSKDHLVKKEYVPGQDDSDGSEDDQDMVEPSDLKKTTMKEPRSKSKGASKKEGSLDTWYLVCDTKKEQEFWVLHFPNCFRLTSWCSRAAS